MYFIIITKIKIIIWEKQTLSSQIVFIVFLSIYSILHICLTGYEAQSLPIAVKEAIKFKGSAR
jgi:hypothetical protein